MIIGIDASRANSKQRTGVESYAFFLIQELKKIINTEEIKVVLYSDKSLYGELADLPEGWTQKVLKWMPRRFWTQIRLSWEMLFHAPDVLFIPAHVFPIIHPKHTVMTVHDVAAIKFPKSYSWFERICSVWSAWFAVQKLWKVIVPTECIKRSLISDFRFQISDLDNVFAVYHGFDRRYRKFDNKNESGQVLEKYKVTQPFIMTIGRLEEKKNTRRIVEAFGVLKQSNLQSEIKNLQLVLVGKPGHGYEKVQAAINKSKFKSDIIVPGWVDEEDIPSLMHATEVFVFPSLYEGFGLPVLEAMASGTPVVAAKYSSLEEVGGSAALYVDPESVPEIAEGIEKLIDNKELYAEKIDQGLERVKEFSWEKCAKETLKVLKPKL